MEQYIIVNVEGTFQKARNKIRTVKEKNPKKLIVVSGANDNLNRQLLEKEKIDIFVPLLARRKDFSKQRNSGFNQVMAKIAKKNKVIIGINFDEIIAAKGKERSRIFARVKQNINLCKKDKLKMTFVGANKRKKQEFLSLGIVLGMPTWMPFFFD